MHSHPPDSDRDPDFDPDEFDLDEFGEPIRDFDHDPAEHRDLPAEAPTKPPSVIRQLWKPVPVPPPVIDPDFRELHWLERTVEVIRYSVLSVEHWLSRRGVLREWIRLCLYFAAVLTVAALLIIPPVTAILEGAAEWTTLLGNVVANVTNAVLRLPPIILGIATLFLLFRLGRHQRICPWPRPENRP